MKWTPEQVDRVQKYGLCWRCGAPRLARLERRGTEHRHTMVCENGHYADDPWAEPEPGWVLETNE